MGACLWMFSAKVTSTQWLKYVQIWVHVPRHQVVGECIRRHHSAGAI
jgi:hypothetical protein